MSQQRWKQYSKNESCISKTMGQPFVLVRMQYMSRVMYVNLCKDVCM